MVASPAFSEHKHRLNCFPNKSEKQSKSYWFGSGLLQNRYTSVFKDLTRVGHVFYCIFRDLRRFFWTFKNKSTQLRTLRIRRHAPVYAIRDNEAASRNLDTLNQCFQE